MKIDYAIHASDDNPLYLDFWEPVSKIWKLKFGIEPVLLYFGEGNPSTEYGKVIRMKIIKEYPIATQCQWSRFWYATTLGNKVGIISDIDMLPLSKHYFCDQIENIENKYIHLNPCFDTYPNIAACYHVASGKNFNKVLGTHKTFKESIRTLMASIKGGQVWFYDEVFSTYMIRNYKNKSLFEYIARDGGQNGHRIDRPKWGYDENLLKQNWYYDAHCVRPYSIHKEDIDNIVRITINATD